MNKPIIKCVCHQVTFKELLDYSEANNIQTLDSLIQRNISATACGFCKPYIKKMFLTQETEFAIMTREEIDIVSNLS